MMISVRLRLLVLVLLLCTLQAAGQKATVVYYHRANVTEAEWAQQIIALFNERFPDIEAVSLSSGTGGGKEYAEKLAVLRASGNAPDAFFGSTDKLGFTLKGWTLDITKYVERDKKEVNPSDFFPGVFESFTYGGRIFGIPLTVTPQMLFYNKDLFARHGLQPLPVDWNDRSWTWDAMIEYSKKLTLIGSDGVATQLAITQATENHLPDVCWMHGGDWFDEEAYRTGRATKASLLRNENIQAYEAVVDLYQRYAAAGPPKGISTTGFQNGTIAMDWIGAWKMNTYIEARRSGAMKFEWGLGPIPLAVNRQNTRWTDPLFISSTTKQPDATWEFVKFATGDAGQSLWAKMTNKIPARRTVLGTYMRCVSDFTGIEESVIAATIGGALASGRRSLEESISDIPLVIVNRRSEWIDPMVAGTLPVRTALATMEMALNAVLQELRTK